MDALPGLPGPGVAIASAMSTGSGAGTRTAAWPAARVPGEAPGTSPEAGQPPPAGAKSKVKRRPLHGKPRFGSVTLLTFFLFTAHAHPGQPGLRPDGRGGHARQHRGAVHPAVVRAVLDHRPDSAQRRGPAGAHRDVPVRAGRAGQLRRGHDPEHHGAGDPGRGPRADPRGGVRRAGRGTQPDHHQLRAAGHAAAPGGDPGRGGRGSSASPSSTPGSTSPTTSTSPG